MCGVSTAACGILFWFLFPNSPLDARFLKKQERVLAVERVRVNSQGIGNKRFKGYQFREALTEPIVWAITSVALIMNITNGALSNWFSQLSKPFTFLACHSGMLEVT